MRYEEIFSGFLTFLGLALALGVNIYCMLVIDKIEDREEEEKKMHLQIDKKKGQPLMVKTILNSDHLYIREIKSNEDYHRRYGYIAYLQEKR
jgi:hypothetical protein